MGQIVIPCEYRADDDCGLQYSINPGGSQSAVRTNSTGSIIGGSTVGPAKGPASKWPYYYWTCARSIVHFDLSGYENPGIILSTKIAFQTRYVSQYIGSDWANGYLYALDPEGDIPTPDDLTGDDYGKMLGHTTILGSMPGTDYQTLPAGYEWYVTLNDAGKAHLGWGSPTLTAFTLRTNKDVYDLTPDSYAEVCFYWYGISASVNQRPRLILEVIDEPYVPFRGLFVRGDEIQAVFSSPADSISRAYRSPDFGATWYPMSGMNDVPIFDVGFDVADPQKSVIGGDGKVYKFDSADGGVYNFIEGATISGQATRIDVDYESNIAVVGTSQKLYKTPNFGEDVYELWNGAVSGVALGGNEVSVFGDPPVSGMILDVNGDGDVYYKSGFYGWNPNPTRANGSYWMNLLEQDMDWNPGGTWGYYENGMAITNDMTTLITATFSFEDPTSAQETLLERGILEVRIVNMIGKNTYPYGNMETKIRTHSTNYVTAERGVNGAGIESRSGVAVKNPNTGDDWTVDEVKSMWGGCNAGECASYGAVTLDQVYAEVWYDGIGLTSVGTAPTGRESTVSLGDTVINIARPSPVNGTVRTVQLYLASAATVCRIGIFYNTTGNYYSTRSWVNVGALDAGYNNIPVNLEIREGEYIGIYADAQIEADYGFVASYDGYRHSVAGGNQIPCSNEEFSGATARVISLRGVIYS